jgi:enoyl-CoA hydratase/carnithine racemase
MTIALEGFRMKKVERTRYDESGALLIRLNESPGNQFTQELLVELYDILHSLEEDDELYSIIITGSDKIFSVGGDILGMYDAIKKNKPADYVKQILPLVHKVILKIIRHKLPIIAAINGSAAGGGLSLALSCDYRICVNNAKLSMAFGKVALTPDSGSSVLFQERFNQALALDGTSKGKIFSPEQAFDYGAVNMIVDNKDLIDQSLAIAAEYLNVSRWVTSKTKYLVNKTISEKLEKQFEFEYNTILDACRQPEFSRSVEIQVKISKSFNAVQNILFIKRASIAIGS